MQQVLKQEICLATELMERLSPLQQVDDQYNDHLLVLLLEPILQHV